ncbi:MAG TPA: tetratricopeptide repeat protein [Candidatus Cloacimonadota bacterium]|nr:tetratricopeptide repeat protein [Candidatus Cloacimonadota bacterium]HQB41363.1 tetratricopeptide repeat protein [Candidatus Cloacimonadota bacterium]
MKKYYLLLIVLFASMNIFANDLDQLEFARRLNKDNLKTEALMELNKIVVGSKNKSIVNESLFLIAEINESTQQIEKAESIYLQLLSEESNSSPYIREKSLEKLASIYKLNGNWTKALEFYKKLINQYSNTATAKANIIYYLEGFYQLKDYNAIINNGRSLLKTYPEATNQSDIMLMMAKAYYELQIISEVELLLTEIKDKYPESIAYSTSLELQIRLIKRNDGIEAAINEINKSLKKQISRTTEEVLYSLLLDCQIELNQLTEAEKTAKLLVNKFNLSTNLSYYYWKWVKINALLKTPAQVLKESEKINAVLKNTNYENWASLYMAMNYSNANELFLALSLLQDLEVKVQEPELKYEIYCLRAAIYEKQENYTAQLNELKYLTQYYSFLGNNAKLFAEIAKVYQKHYQDPAQAILFYSQALSQSHDMQEKNRIIIQTALCYETQHDYQNALAYYKLLNQNKLSEEDRVLIKHKENYLQLFYVKNNDLLIEELLLQQTDTQQADPVRFAALFGWGLKDYEKAATLLRKINTPHSRNELIKILDLLAYKASLDQNSSQYDILITEISQLNADPELNDNVKNSSSIIISWLNNRGKFDENLITRIEDYLMNAGKQEGFSFDNWFRVWLADYYFSNNLSQKYKQMADSITKDIFINDQDFNKLQLNLAEIYYQEKNYSKAIEHYKHAENWLNLANPIYYHNYVMAKYKTGDIENSIQTLKHIIQNINDIPEINEGRYIIADYAIQKKQYQEGIDIIKSIEPSQRIDKDYIYLSKLYNYTNNLEKEKEALMYIQNKDLTMLRRLAILHEYTKDKIMTKYTWEDLSKKETDNHLKAYAFFSLANISFDEEDFSQANKYYEKAFNLIGKALEIESIPFSIPQMAKRYIICFYKVNNRPKAESLEKEFKTVLNHDPDTLTEIKLVQAIYYIKNDSKKAEKLFNEIIKNNNTPTYLLDEAFLWRGILNMQLKKNKNAEEDFLAIANSEDINIRNQAHLKLGTYYLSTEDFDLAFDYYQAVMLNDTTGVYAIDAASNYAIVAKLTNEWEKAVQVYQMIIDRWGDQNINSETQFNIAFCYYQAKLYDKSIQMFEKYFNDFTTDDLKAEALYWIGENLFSKEEYELAVNSFLKVAYSYPTAIKWSAIAELRAGEAYLSNNQMERGITQLNKVISIYGPGSQAGTEAKKRLNQLGIK